MAGHVQKRKKAGSTAIYVAYGVVLRSNDHRFAAADNVESALRAASSHEDSRASVATLCG